jgi:hypothetical protein
MRKTLAIAIASVLMAMSLTSVAFAQSSVDGYSPDDNAVQNQIEGSPDNTPSNTTEDQGTPSDTTAPGTESGTTPQASASPSSDSGSLPFTGLDLALLAGAGTVLLGLGLTMRHLTRGPESV